MTTIHAPDHEPSQWRTERDSMGELEVPAQHLWGAQTERSRRFFAISDERMPRGVLRALVEVKRAAALANAELGGLPRELADALVAAADEVLAGAWEQEFPLVVWQTGSGTQTNMNVNEVLANRASELLGGARGTDRLVHPNDHVNMGQSSNDTFPTALHVEAARALQEDVLPALRVLRDELSTKVDEHRDTVKLGRTHLQDALPVTFAQEASGWVAQLDHAERTLRDACPALHELALGGTAVGTGLNAHPRFATLACQELARRHDLPFRRAGNPFAALSSGGPLLAAHGAMATLAGALYKIANDIRWLASGPRGGLGELVLPANEPGSSIMPGKVNPTQSEALTMIACRVAGNQTAMGMADTLSNLQLNTARPLMAQAFLQSARLLADGMTSFARHAVAGMRPDAARMRAHVDASLMLVTALAPAIGYDRAAYIAHRAFHEGRGLREVALEEGVSAHDFDATVDPLALTNRDAPHGP